MLVDISFWGWAGFIGLIGAMLVLDVGIFQKDNHRISQKEAWMWSVIWICMALLFNGGIYLWQGHDAAITFLTAYLVEKSLSIDNLFVFVLIFNYFSIPAKMQHRVLYWGILGAVVMRLILILLGIKLIVHFQWLLYVMGAFLVYAGITFFRQRHQEEEFTESRFLKFLKQIIAIKEEPENPHFFVRHKGKFYMTPLFLALVSIELSDLVFAFDSIPAVFGITLDPFLVFTSNIFAILGLRSLYFVLADFLPRFYYLKHALSLILTFVGCKMLLHDMISISTILSLSVIVTIIISSLVLSVQKGR